jgi:hypothetical protein
MSVDARIELTTADTGRATDMRNNDGAPRRRRGFQYVTYCARAAQSEAAIPSPLLVALLTHGPSFPLVNVVGIVWQYEYAVARVDSLRYDPFRNDRVPLFGAVGDDDPAMTACAARGLNEF